MAQLDEKNCLILNLLQVNCRLSLTEISKKIGLSIDSTKKRIQKLINEGIFIPKIQLRPRHFGYPDIVDIKIKLRNYNEKDVKRFIRYLQCNPHVTEIFSISGEWDFGIAVMAKDHAHLGIITEDIRKKFSNTIGEWNEALTKFVYKFENYDMLELMGYKNLKTGRLL